jgi:hypothetical protein
VAAVVQKPADEQLASGLQHTGLCPSECYWVAVV